jgi:hypothetical protein
MKSFWQARSPMQKTLLTCAVMEGVLFFLLFAITRSALSAVVCSAAFFGPASAVFGPSILRHFKAAALKASR